MLKRILRFLCLVFLTAAFLAVDGGYAPFDGAMHIAQAQERKPNFFQRLFGKRSPRVEEAPKVEKKAPKTQVKESRKSEPKNTTTALPKIDEANRIVVIGDLTGDAISKGLTESYKRSPSIVISPRIQNDISIIDDAFYAWLDASDFPFLGERVKAVVVALGTNDRGPILENGRSIAFGSVQWERAYRRRLIDVSAQLQLLNKPVIWVLPPPMINDENTEKAATIAAIQSGSVKPLNFRIVDVQGGFLDHDGKYSAIGANINGKRVQLRDDDGIGFTASGAGKLAHYVQREIDLILDEELNKGLKLEVGGGEQKRSVQQVVILTRPALVQGAELAGSNGRASAFYRDGRAREYFINGKTLNPPRGRADNFEWSEHP